MTNHPTGKHKGGAPTWLAALLALVDALLAALFDNIIDPLASGPIPNQRKLRRMAQQLVVSEARLMRQIHDAVRQRAGLPPDPGPRYIFRAPPRTTGEFGQRLYVHGKMLMNPGACVMRILYRMFQDERRCACASSKFDATPINPVRGPRIAFPTPAPIARALELSG